MINQWWTTYTLSFFKEKFAITRPLGMAVNYKLFYRIVCVLMCVCTESQHIILKYTASVETKILFTNNYRILPWTAGGE